METKCFVAFNLLERWCRACVRALVPQGVSPESDQEESTHPSRRTLRFDGGEPRPRSLRRWGEAVARGPSSMLQPCQGFQLGFGGDQVTIPGDKEGGAGTFS